jgi:hypothetical protein
MPRMHRLPPMRRFHNNINWSLDSSTGSGHSAPINTNLMLTSRGMIYMNPLHDSNVSDGEFDDEDTIKKRPLKPSTSAAWSDLSSDG